MVDVDKTLALICAAIYVVIDLTYLARLRTSMARDVTKQKESWGTRRLTLLRREMQDRLESALLDNSHYVFLQRMSLIAPLMGVIITAQGFIRYFVPSNDDAKLDAAKLMVHIGPLFYGVLVGASLALAHQFVLQWASRVYRSVLAIAEASLQEMDASDPGDAIGDFAEQLRNFSSALGNQQKEILEIGQERVLGVGSQMEKLAETVGKVIQDCRQGGHSLETAAEQFAHQVDRSAEVLREEVGRLGAGLDGSLKRLEQGMIQSQSSMDSNLISMQQQMTATVERMVESLKSQDEQLGEVHTRLVASQQRFDSLAETIITMASDVASASAETRDRVSGQVIGFSERITTASETMSRIADEFASIRQSVSEDESERRDLVQQTMDAVEAFSRDMQSTSRQVGGAASTIENAMQGIQESVRQDNESRGELLRGGTASIDKFAAGMQSVAGQIQGAASSLQQATDGILRSSSQLAGQLEQTSQGVETLRQASLDTQEVVRSLQDLRRKPKRRFRFRLPKWIKRRRVG